MKLERVNSRAIDLLGYDAEKRVVRVRYVGGGMYDYSDVPQQVYVEIRNAKSIGTAVNQLLKEYKFVRVN